MPCTSRTASSNASGQPVGARLAQRLARADDDVAQQARRAVGAPAAARPGPFPRLLQREREHVGDLVLAAMGGVERADAALADELDRRLRAVDALGLEDARDQPRDGLVVDLDPCRVQHFDEIHVSRSPPGRRVADLRVFSASALSPWSL